MITEPETPQRIRVVVSRPESDFDRACDTAFSLAVGQLGMDEDGYVNGVKCDGITVKFVSYEHRSSPVGHSHIYVFTATRQWNAAI